MSVVLRGIKQMVVVLGWLAVVAALLTLLGLGVGPRTGKYRTMTVLTGSMGETMPPGSVAVQTPKRLGDVLPGDIISYHIPVEDRRLVTHRVVEIVEGGAEPTVITKGDANSAPDPWVVKLSGGMTWETRGVVPRLGFVLQELRSPNVRRLTVLALPVVLAVLWLVDIWRSPAPRRRPVAV